MLSNAFAALRLLQRLLFGSHSSSDWRRQQFGALLGAIAQYDVHATPSHFLKHALAALPPAWRLSHEIAAAVAAEVLVAPPVACDGRAIHPALVDAHTRVCLMRVSTIINLFGSNCHVSALFLIVHQYRHVWFILMCFIDLSAFSQGDFCSEWWTVLCHAEHWLPLHLAGARRPLHDALARVRLRAYSLLFCRDADTAAAQCIADEDTNANAASASVNDRDSLEAGLCALSLTGSAVPLPLPTSPPPPPPPRPVVAATASATASAQSAAQSASQKRRARKKRAKQVQAVDSASNDAVATLSPSSIALHADSPPLAAAASDDDADDDVCDNNATLDLKQSVPSFALVSSSASRGNAVSRPVTVTLVTEHGAWRVGSKAQVRLKSRPGCVPSSFHRRDDDPNDCDRPLYMSALDGHLSLCERRRIALSVFDLDQKNYSDSDRRELPGTADAQFIIALAACMQLHTGVVDGDAGATDDVGDDTWSSLVAPCAFIMSSALFQSSLHSSDRASSADHLAAFTESSLSMDLDSLDAVFSADAQQAAHALHSMLELVLPVNALLAWPFGGALPLERYLGDGVTLHRCVRALQKQQRQQQPAPSAERLADATAAQTRERGSNGPSEIAAMRDMMRRASAALGQSAAAAASEPEVERLLSLWAMLR